MLGWFNYLTHRQFSAWSAWIRNEWNVPSRTDNYLMQIAYHVILGYAKEPMKVDGDKLIIKFEFKEDENRKVKTIEEIEEEKKRKTEMSKSKWLGVVFGNRSGL